MGSGGRASRGEGGGGGGSGGTGVGGGVGGGSRGVRGNVWTLFSRCFYDLSWAPSRSPAGAGRLVSKSILIVHRGEE
jgi:hypothetical protein